MNPGHILRIFLSAQMGTGGLVDDCFLKMPWQQFDWNPFNIPLRLPAACRDLFELFYTLADSLKVLLFCFPLTCNEWPQCGNCSPFKWKWQEKKSLGRLLNERKRLVWTLISWPIFHSHILIFLTVMIQSSAIGRRVILQRSSHHQQLVCQAK